MTAHAPMSKIFDLPLIVRSDQIRAEINDASGFVCDVMGDDDMERATAIARAVNAHDDLVEVVERFTQAGVCGGSCYYEPINVTDKTFLCRLAFDALAKARKGS